MDNREWLASMEQLQERGERLQQQAVTAQAEIDAILAANAPANVGIVVELDAAGIVEAIELPPGIRTTHTAEELGRQVTRAISVAVDARRSALAGQTELPVSGADFDNLMASIFGGVAVEPERIVNDFKTLTIEVFRGEIVGVEPDARWVASTKESSIAEEIVRMARIAADASSR
ncbi:hypothetical protein GCM10027413_32020 [Conyzicola nivalis]|uniref:YbaB/EbfC DNA-binding family protein n=1 Tax=Conyzicola nivalis TaxID=1477021 RepID=A0A916SSV2_9MICO|nr:hypothetical protein [Conyzicola nivalis]GGB11640.1 hypothetical protein GCM10010979_27450 [Conyzicola nivalis]